MKGFKGDRGLTGDKGEPGPPGRDGLPGDKGLQGFSVCISIRKKLWKKVSFHQNYLIYDKYTIINIFCK